MGANDKGTMNCKKKLNFDKGLGEPAAEVTECIICRESFEDWVQCTKCKGWAHVECADQENILFFMCDICKKLINAIGV